MKKRVLHIALIINSIISFSQPIIEFEKKLWRKFRGASHFFY